MSKIYVLEENRTGSQEFTQEGLEWCGECFSPIEKEHNKKVWSKPLIKQKNTWESLFFIITNILKIQKKRKRQRPKHCKTMPSPKGMGCL